METLLFCGLLFFFRVYMLSRCERIKTETWARADAERSLMYNKFIELKEDPAMTDAKWAEWLPVFEYTDRCYAEKSHNKVKFFSLAEAARKQIDDNSFLQGV